MTNTKSDWTDKEYAEYFTFTGEMKSNSPDVVYYGDLIELLNPNIVRSSIQEIPEHSNEKPNPTKLELEGLKNLLEFDPTLMVNRYQIKQIKPPDEE